MTPQSISPDELLLQKLLLKMAVSDNKTEALKILSSFSLTHPDFDWIERPSFIATRMLLHYASDALTLPLSKNLKQYLIASHLHSTTHVLKIRNEVLNLSKRFQESGLTVIFLKGSGRLFTTYKDDPGQRIFHDIDLWVPPHELAAAEEVLKQAGFNEDYPLLNKLNNSRCDRTWYRKNYFHYVYFKKNLTLDLHWTIGYKSSPSLTKEILKSKHTVLFEKTQVPILNPEADLFITCLNFLQDIRPYVLNSSWTKNPDNLSYNFYNSLLVITEIRRILELNKSDLDWVLWLRLVKRFNHEYFMITFLILAQKIGKINIPENVLNLWMKKQSVAKFVKMTKTMSNYDILSLLNFQLKSYRRHYVLTKLSTRPVLLLKELTFKAFNIH